MRKPGLLPGPGDDHRPQRGVGLGQPGVVELLAGHLRDDGVQQAPVGLVDPGPDLADDHRRQADRQVEDALEHPRADDAGIQQQRQHQAQARSAARSPPPSRSSVLIAACRNSRSVAILAKLSKPDKAVVRVEAVPVGEAVVERAEQRPDHEQPEDRQRQRPEARCARSGCAVPSVPSRGKPGPPRKGRPGSSVIP